MDCDVDCEILVDCVRLVDWLVLDVLVDSLTESEVDCVRDVD